MRYYTMARSPINSASTLIEAAGSWRTMVEILEICKAENAQYVAMERDGDVFTWHVNPFHTDQNVKFKMMLELGDWSATHGGTVHMYLGKIPHELRGRWKTKCYSLEDLLK